MDLSSTPLTYHVAPMVNACEAVSSKCVQASVPLLTSRCHLFFLACMLAGPELACWPVCSTSKYGSIPLSSLLGHCFLDFPTSMFWDFKTRPMSPIPSSTSCIPRGSQWDWSMLVFRLSTKVRLVKAMVFPVVMCGCESWTIKKAECWRTDVFELWCWRRLFIESLGLQGDPTSPS